MNRLAVAVAVALTLTGCGRAAPPASIDVAAYGAFPDDNIDDTEAIAAAAAAAAAVCGVVVFAAGVYDVTAPPIRRVDTTAPKGSRCPQPRP